MKPTKATQAMAAIALMATWIATAPAKELNPYVSYSFSEKRETESDHRYVNTQIFLTADGFAGYRYRDQVTGATTPTVRSVEFSNEYRKKATAEEKSALVQALLAAKIFDLAKEPQADSSGFRSHLDVRIGSEETRTHFSLPPNTPQRTAIHDIMLQFAKRMKIDTPENREQATTISEGDLQPARKVSLAEVLAHPDKYHGKRVSVAGFYHGEFEGSNLAVDESASNSRDYERSVWRAGESSFAEKADLQDRNDSWLRVEGVFLRGPGGHMGLWPGEIVRVTRIEPIPKPKFDP